MDAKLDFFKSKKGKDDFLFVEGLGKPEVVTENSKDGGVQTYLQGLALPNGLTSRNGVTYKTESVEKAHGSMKGASMLFNHDPENVVGHVVETWMTSEGMMYKADINPEAKLSNGVNLLESVKRGDLSKVSIRASIDREESFENDQGVVEAFVKEFLELSFVSIPGFKDTSISFESVGKGDFIMDNKEEDNQERLSDKVVNVVIDGIKSMYLRQVESDTGEFKHVIALTPSEAERELLKVDYPDSGYLKYDVTIKFRVGNDLEGFRYRHGEYELSFSKQLSNYFRDFVSIKESVNSMEKDNKEDKKLGSDRSEESVVVKEDLVSLVERVNALESEIGLLKESFENKEAYEFDYNAGVGNHDMVVHVLKKNNIKYVVLKPGTFRILNSPYDRDTFIKKLYNGSLKQSFEKEEADGSKKYDSDSDSDSDDDDEEMSKKKKSVEADKDKEKPVDNKDDDDDDDEDDESEDLGEVEAAARQQSVNKTINEKTNTDDEKKAVSVKELFNAWTNGFK